MIDILKLAEEICINPLRVKHAKIISGEPSEQAVKLRVTTCPQCDSKFYPEAAILQCTECGAVFTTWPYSDIDAR